MTYIEITEYFTEPRADYWETLLLHSPVILQQLNISNQGIMSKELGLTQPQMSTVVKMLRAYCNVSNAANIVNVQSTDKDPFSMLANIEISEGGKL